jgi:hypothetical protein
MTHPHPRALEAAARALCLCDDPDADALLLSGKPAWTAHIEEARAAVNAYIAEAGDGWMPIETAPKDGTLFLIERPDYDSSSISIAFWHTGQNVPGFVHKATGQAVDARYYTLYRPLPAPPAAAQEKK